MSSSTRPPPTTTSIMNINEKYYFLATKTALRVKHSYILKKHHFGNHHVSENTFDVCCCVLAFKATIIMMKAELKVELLIRRNHTICVYLTRLTVSVFIVFCLPTFSALSRFISQPLEGAVSHLIVFTWRPKDMSPL